MPHRVAEASVNCTPCAALLAFAAIVPVSAANFDERCGLGPSPDSPDFKAYHEERESIRAQLGYEFVCDQYILTIGASSYRLESLEKVQSKLAFQPVQLGGTLFASYTELGARPYIVGNSHGAGALHRYFAGNSGEVLELFEFDTSLGGGVQVLDQKRQTEQVKGQRAMLTILESKSGKAFSILTWVENRRHIELSINRNVRKTGYAEFMQLAESMPAPIPALPNAPKPKGGWPPPFGPGADFPDHPPE